LGSPTGWVDLGRVDCAKSTIFWGGELGLYKIDQKLEKVRMKQDEGLMGHLNVNGYIVQMCVRI